MTFFLPKSLPKVTKKFKGFFINLLNIYGKFRHDREIKKRQRQFEKNVNYVEELEKEESVEKVNKVKSDFDNIEIFENKK